MYAARLACAANAVCAAYAACAAAYAVPGGPKRFGFVGGAKNVGGPPLKMWGVEKSGGHRR